MRRALAALAALSCLAGPARSEERVVLESPGGLRLEGELVGREGRFLRIATASGVVTADRSVFSCEGSACPDDAAAVAEIVLAGEPALTAVLVPALLEAFAASRGLAAERVADADGAAVYVLSDADDVAGLFRVVPGTNAEAIALLEAERASAVLTTRPVALRERGEAEDAGGGDPGHPDRGRVLALTGLVPVVGSGTGVSEISLPQLAALFAGELDDWGRVGGASLPVRLHLPEVDTGLEPAFRRLVMDVAGLEPSERIVRHADEASLVAAVAGEPGALGIASAGRALPVAVLDLRTACGPRLLATREAIRSGDWPLTVPLEVYLPARPMPPLAAAFVRYALSPDAQLVVRRAGLVDQSRTSLPIAMQGERFAAAILAASGEEELAALQAMVRRLRPLTRLGATFRFAPGGTRLDSVSRERAIRLAEEGRGGRLLLVGFSDGVGGAEANRALAERRALRVRDAILAAVPEGAEAPVIEVASFGEALPVACDDTPWGRRLNRRVEVWTD